MAEWYPWVIETPVPATDSASLWFLKVMHEEVSNRDPEIGDVEVHQKVIY